MVSVVDVGVGPGGSSQGGVSGDTGDHTTSGVSCGVGVGTGVTGDAGKWC